MEEFIEKHPVLVWIALIVAITRMLGWW